jgi:hypothetical protein
MGAQKVAGRDLTSMSVYVTRGPRTAPPPDAPATKKERKDEEDEEEEGFGGPSSSSSCVSSRSIRGDRGEPSNKGDGRVG